MKQIIRSVNLKNLLVGLLCILSITTKAQNSTTKVKGRVMDPNGEPIPFAHVYVNDKIGTISNDSGYFQLKIPDGHEEIIFSSIGYVSDTLSVSLLKTTPSLNVELRRRKSLLPPVTIEAEKILVDSAKVILNLVMKNIKKNYPRMKYSMEGFYRETSINDTIYTRLVEGQFSVSDRGYDNSLGKIRIRKEHLRKTEDNRNLNWRSSLNEWLYRKNGLYMLLYLDRIRLKSETDFGYNLNTKENYETIEAYKEDGLPFRFLSKKFIDSTNVYISNITEQNGVKIYTLEYEKKPRFNFWYMSKALGNITINGSDWSVISWSSKHVFDEKAYLDRHKDDLPDSIDYKRNHFYSLNKNRLINHDYFYSVDYKYQKNIDGKYYLQKIQYKTTGSLSTAHQSEQGFGSSFYSDFQEGNIYTMIEFEVSKIKKYEKIKWIDNLDDDDDIYDLSVTDNAEFWRSANLSPLTPISPKMLRDLSNGKEQKIKYIK